MTKSNSNLHEASDFAALSSDIRKRREAARLPEIQSETVTPEHVVSGCGPGPSVAEGTPQDGVRSKLSRAVVALDVELWTWICHMHIHRTSKSTSERRN